jgi:glycosyltransferase involved in cell wall biosynthesis
METKQLKLIIQIPCYNEADTLAVSLACLPKSVPGIDKVEVLIIDDGSQDNTVEVAKACGVDHVVRHSHNMGLAVAFMTGINTCLKLGADIIVNTDADNQYNADDIPALVKPIIDCKAQYVIGTRPINQIGHFSPVKKLLQKFGSLMVRAISGTVVEDAPSGFRAIEREAAFKLNVFSSYTYTLETIIQAGNKNISMMCVPIRVNSDLRPSRLVKSIFSYVRRSIWTMVRMFIVYSPFKFFMTIGTIVFSLGVLLGMRFLIYWLMGKGQGMMQSLILVSILILIGTISFMMAFIADLLAVNRKLLEELQYNQRKSICDRSSENDVTKV